MNDSTNDDEDDHHHHHDVAQLQLQFLHLQQLVTPLRRRSRRPAQVTGKEARTTPTSRFKHHASTQRNLERF
jgi:hypothetical protein